MAKGTASKGKLSRGRVHIICRRCGNRTMHKSSGVCSKCGFGKTAKIKSYAWSNA